MGMGAFTLSCESTVDMPFSYIKGRGIPVLFYSYVVDGVEHPDDMGRDPAAMSMFYRILEEKVPSTSQINTATYVRFFEEQLRQGSDLLHIALGSGMTTSVDNAMTAAELVRERFPDRKVVVIDSICSSSGYGMLVDYAADMRDAGRTMDEVAGWVEANRHDVHHQFYSTELRYYQRSGRMSGPAAAIATVLNICPIMRLDDRGRIIAYEKVRGKKRALERTIEVVQEHIRDGVDYEGKCFVAHSNSPKQAELAKKALEDRFPRLKGKVRIFEIGTIIASHCGPGTVAVFFLGDHRWPES